eukprot:TRINITY_DN3907_c0_g1_i1.p1 TRINITY_DN3907_c0_g1~~TRINITY_DN3907_c0_g1_i1.p1  ORF type:complete len:421 (+),score=91.44 TRINITY_DN3907_c0_g1_i1:1517-2779(+)
MIGSRCGDLLRSRCNEEKIAGLMLISQLMHKQPQYASQLAQYAFRALGSSFFKSLLLKRDDETDPNANWNVILAITIMAATPASVSDESLLQLLLESAVLKSPPQSCDDQKHEQQQQKQPFLDIVDILRANDKHVQLLHAMLDSGEWIKHYECFCNILLEYIEKTSNRTSAADNDSLMSKFASILADSPGSLSSIRILNPLTVMLQGLEFNEQRYKKWSRQLRIGLVSMLSNRLDDPTRLDVLRLCVGAFESLPKKWAIEASEEEEGRRMGDLVKLACSVAAIEVQVQAGSLLHLMETHGECDIPNCLLSVSVRILEICLLRLTCDDEDSDSTCDSFCWHELEGEVLVLIYQRLKDSFNCVTDFISGLILLREETSNDNFLVISGSLISCARMMRLWMEVEADAPGLQELVAFCDSTMNL